MEPPRNRLREGGADAHAQVRQQLIALIRKGRRTSAFTHKRPTDVRFQEIVHPESGMPLTDVSMWHEILRLLESEVSLEAIVLNQPPGEKAWVFVERLAPDSPPIYVKLQLLGSSVLLRSFHPSEPAHD